MDTIGVIGLGLLGSAIAERLVAAGHAVAGYDVSEAAMTRALTLGIAATGSVAELFERCERVILSLPDSHIVADVVAQGGTRLQGRLVIDTTTGSPDDAVAISRKAAALGGGYVESTVIGSSSVVRQGEAVVLLAGAAADCDAASALIDCFAGRRFYVGGPGSASQAKLVVNLVLGLNRAVLAEGLQLARRCGLDPAGMLEILRSGAASSRVMDAKGRRMVEGDFTPEARLAQHHKDVRLILELAERVAARVPLSVEHERLLSEAERLGLGEQDNSAIVRVFAGDA